MRHQRPGGMTTTFEELLARDGYLVYRTRGVSMEPMLRENRDLVVIRVPALRLKKYDVALYKRGSVYVLHRVIGVEKDHYRIRGDNTYAVELVPDGDVIGVLTAFKRKGREIDAKDRGYVLYARLWNGIYPARALLARGRGRAVALARRMGILPVVKKLMGRDRP